MIRSKQYRGPVRMGQTLWETHIFIPPFKNCFRNLGLILQRDLDLAKLWLSQGLKFKTLVLARPRT